MSAPARSLIVALAAAALCLLAPLARADELDSAIADCRRQAIDQLATDEPEFVNDLEGGLHEARIWADCTAQTAERVARGEILSGLTFSPDRLNRLSSWGTRTAEVLDDAILSSGRRRLKAMKKAHKEMRDFELLFDLTNEAAFMANRAVFLAEAAEVDRLYRGIDELAQRIEDTGRANHPKFAKATKGLALVEAVLDSAVESFDEAANPVLLAAGLDRNELSASAYAVRIRGYERAHKKGVNAVFRKLAAAHKILTKAERLIDQGIRILTSTTGPCQRTSKFVREIGGGWVALSRDGGPEQILKGSTDVEDSLWADVPTRHISFGSDSQYEPGVPHLDFGLQGDAYEREGTHAISNYPEPDPDGERRNFLFGWFRNRPSSGGSTLYVIREGTVTIDRIRIGSKSGQRLIEGSFDVIATQPNSTTSTRLTGRFHLCRFLVGNRTLDDFWYD